jgi:hypothetical protein
MLVNVLESVFGFESWDVIVDKDVSQLKRLDMILLLSIYF